VPTPVAEEGPKRYSGSLSMAKRIVSAIKRGHQQSIRTVFLEFNLKRHQGPKYVRWLRKAIGVSISVCADCNSPSIASLTRTLTSEAKRVCPHCARNYTHCQECQTTFLRTAMHIDEYRAICIPCRDRFYSRCTICEVLWRQSEMSSRDRSICAHCFMSRPRDLDFNPRLLGEPPNIAGHGDNVLGYCAPFPRPKDGILLGVELEVEVQGLGSPNRDGDGRLISSSVVQEVATHTHTLLHEDGRRFAFLKQDGSLSGYAGGFEIVSAPAGLDDHARIWRRFFQERNQRLRGHESGNCGMHIHIGRYGMSFPPFLEPIEKRKPTVPGLSPGVRESRTRLGETAAHLWRMWQFLSHPDHYGLVTDIAGRSLTTGNGGNFAAIRRDDRRSTARSVKPQYQSGASRRYMALNWLNDNTVEFRMFNSTLNYNTFMKNLEFAHALVMFTRPGRIAFIQKQCLKEFFEFVKDERKTYPALFAFLGFKNYGHGMFKVKPRPVAMQETQQQAPQPTTLAVPTPEIVDAQPTTTRRRRIVCA